MKRHKQSRRPLQITKIGEDAHLGQMHIEHAQIRPCSGAAVPGMGMGGYTGLEELQTLLAMHTCACFTTLQLWPHWTIAHSSKVFKAVDMCSTFGTAHLGAQGRVLHYTASLPLLVLLPTTNLIPLYTHPYYFHPTSRGPFSLCSLF
jgi:hypothetical protein